MEPMTRNSDDDEYREQIKLLIDDLKAATAGKDYEGGLFCLWQIFELSRKHNKGRTPNPEVVNMIEQGNNIEIMQAVIAEVERRFGKPPR
jgi:hypothetical protein